MAAKPLLRREFLEVQYDQERWDLLRRLRERAQSLMEALASRNIRSIIYGSIARGDVGTGSDVDVFAPDASSSVAIELALEQNKIRPLQRVLVQATPSYAPKAYFEVEERTSVSMPLVRLRSVEREFYKFAGEMGLNELKLNRRVVGVDKRLMLIEPTETGHIEASILGHESHTAKRLGIAMRTVHDRVHALTKRDKVGRTGLFVERELEPDQTFESIIRLLSAKNPALRRRMRLYGKR